MTRSTLILMDLSHHIRPSMTGVTGTVPGKISGEMLGMGTGSARMTIKTAYIGSRSDNIFHRGVRSLDIIDPSRVMTLTAA